MIVGDERAKWLQVKPNKKVLSWCDMVQRIRRAMSDMRVKAGAELVITNSSGGEAMGTVEMLDHPGGLPPGAKAYFGYVIGDPALRASLMYGGIVSNGTACVLDCYGSCRPKGGSSMSLASWGMLVDQAVAKMSIELTGWGKIIKELRTKGISKDRADVACYRAFHQGAICATDFSTVRKLRREGPETPWQVIQALAASLIDRSPLGYNPRTDAMKKNHAMVNIVRSVTGI